MNHHTRTLWHRILRQHRKDRRAFSQILKGMGYSKADRDAYYRGERRPAPPTTHHHGRASSR